MLRVMTFEPIEQPDLLTLATRFLKKRVTLPHCCLSLSSRKQRTLRHAVAVPDAWCGLTHVICAHLICRPTSAHRRTSQKISERTTLTTTQVAIGA